MKTNSLEAIIVVLVVLSGIQAFDQDAFLKEMEEFNSWSEKNRNNKKYQSNKYKPATQTISTEEEIGGIEAMKFMHMYRKNQRGNIGDKIDLFKEFYEHDEHIDKTTFYRLATVWLKRRHYEMVTGQRYVDQDHVIKKLERQNLRKIANEEIRDLPISKLFKEMDRVFGDKEKFSIIDGAHWLVDENLYGKIGPHIVDEILKDSVKVTPVPELVEPGVASEEVDLKSLADEPMEEIEENKIDEENNKIDL